MLKRSTRRRANRGSCGSFQGLAISRPYATRTPSSVCLAIWRSTAMLTGSERMTLDGFGGVGDLVAEHTAIEAQSRMVDAPLHPTGTQPVLSSGLTSCPRSCRGRPSLRGNHSLLRFNHSPSDLIFDLIIEQRTCSTVMHNATPSRRRKRKSRIRFSGSPCSDRHRGVPLLHGGGRHYCLHADRAHSDRTSLFPLPGLTR
jgi:hypothetical protein